MPELPEVETIKRELSKKLVGKTIKKVEVLWPKTVFPSSVSKFKKSVNNQKITDINRRAKMLLIEFKSRNALVVHLKMTGQLIFVPKNGQIISGGHPTHDLQTPGRHTRVIFHFTDDSNLYFNDLRKFGWIKLNDDKLTSHIDKNYGPEPLDKKFTSQKFSEIILNYPNRTIKQVLLDQTLIAGVGNIYADEACFLSGVRPDRRIKKLSPIEIQKLHKNLISVLRLSISKGGTSSKNYRRSDGSVGGFMSYLNVYGRANEKCKVCGLTIQKIRHVGRGTHFCEQCQK